MSLHKHPPLIDYIASVSSMHAAYIVLQFQSLVYSSDHSIVCFCETWLTDSILDYEIFPYEYVIYRKDRSSRGGGVLVAIKNHLPSCLISSPSHIEILCVNIGISNPILLCTLYLPPNPYLSYFKDMIEYLSATLSTNIPCLICGDFNLPGVCWSTLTGNSSLSNTFCEFVFNWNLT